MNWPKKYNLWSWRESNPRPVKASISFLQCLVISRVSEGSRSENLRATSPVSSYFIGCCGDTHSLTNLKLVDAVHAVYQVSSADHNGY